MRKPSAFLLGGQCITLYNKLPTDGKPVNGGLVEKYSRIILRSVRYTQCEGAITASSHGAVSDSLHVILFLDDDTGHWYRSPEQFANSSEGWTLQKGLDYIALGEQTDDKPSIDGAGMRNDFKITSVDIRYNSDGTIHHFEVNAK